jgi:uncharacterized protein (TIGR02300 family)
MVDKERFGDRHTCYSCGGKFYDMHRNPPICPKCGTDVSQKPKEHEEPAYVAPELEPEEEEEIPEELDEKSIDVEPDEELVREGEEPDEP